MKSTRDRILQTLLKFPGSSINQLAEAVDINAISVRHHLTNLQAEGLVSAEEERHGVGRPKLVYSLTEAGGEQFPSSYLQLTNKLLDQLKETMTNNEIFELFANIARSLYSDYESEFKNLSLEEKLNLTQKILSKEGYSIEWESNDDHYLVHEISCPYYHIGKKHPEVCNIDRTLIATMLALPVKQINCLLNGDSHCTFVINQS